MLKDKENSGQEVKQRKEGKRSKKERGVKVRYTDRGKGGEKKERKTEGGRE